MNASLLLTIALSSTPSDPKATEELPRWSWLCIVTLGKDKPMSAEPAPTHETPNTPESHRLTITVDSATYALIQAFAAQFSQSVEGTAAALLAAELVRGPEEIQAPDPDGRIFTRGEVLHIALAAERSRTAQLEAALTTLRREMRSVAATMARIAE